MVRGNESQFSVLSGCKSPQTHQLVAARGQVTAEVMLHWVPPVSLKSELSYMSLMH